MPSTRSSSTLLVSCLLLAACGDPRSNGSTFTDSGVQLDGGADESTDEGPPGPDMGMDEGPDEGVDEGPDEGVDEGPDESTDEGLPELQECEYLSSSYGSALEVLEVPAGSNSRIGFELLGLPDPAVVESAVLHFDTYDADHPGEEGTVYVNGAGPYQLPANVDWDNMNGTGLIDVSGATIDGNNVVEFGAGSLQPSSFYHVGNVRIVLEAHVDSCEAVMDPPDPNAIEREQQYDEAEYTERHNWVLRCAANFEYAFTAYSAEHIPSDCEGLYDPDGNRTGTAIFHFGAVAASNYEIQIHSRHTVNRNPAGALFVVDGIGKRVHQDDDKDFTTDIWGTKWLSGDIDVVLDSTMENQSDSVTWVKIVPVP